MAKVPFRPSPRGVARYAWLDKPDTKYNRDGVYTVDLGLAGEDAELFKGVVDKLVDAAYDEQTADMDKKEAAKWTRYYPYDEDGETVWFKFRQNAVLEVEGEKKQVYISKYDANDRKVEVAIFGGSELRVMYKHRMIVIAKDRMVGVRLDFFKVQVLKLADREELPGGFGEVEDGYVYDDQEPDQEPPFNADDRESDY